MSEGPLRRCELGHVERDAQGDRDDGGEEEQEAAKVEQRLRVTLVSEKDRPCLARSVRHTRRSSACSSCCDISALASREEAARWMKGTATIASAVDAVRPKSTFAEQPGG